MKQDDIEAKVSRISNAVDRHTEQLKMLNAPQAHSHLVALEKRIAELGERLQLEILKITVLTEVSRVSPRTTPALIKALDNDAAWWRKGEHLSIGAWTKRLAGAA